MSAARYVCLGAIVTLTACGGTSGSTARPLVADVPPATVPTPPEPAAAPPPPTPAPRGGMALGPALVLVQNVEPGVASGHGVAYRVENRGTTPLNLSLAVQPPAQAGTPIWELGYEPLPDPTWFTIEPAQIELAPGESREAILNWLVPDGPAFANRRFAVCVLMRPGGAAAFGAGLALAARVQFETACNTSADAGAMAALATIPAQLAVELAPGNTLERSVLLRRNGAKDDADLAWTSLEAAEPEPERRMRYATPGTIPAVIAIPAQGSVTVHGEAWVPLTLTLQAPANAVPGTRLEQILLVGTPDQLAIATAERRITQPQTALVRCLVTIVAGENP